MKKAVFLDRDGVLCEAIVVDGKPFSANRPDLSDLLIHPQTMEACRQLKEAGFKLLCFSNQPEITRGGLSWETLKKQNELIMKYCFLDELAVCPHDNNDHCACRKPSPGMIYHLAIDHQIDIAKSYLIGDRWPDIEAGARAMMKTMNFYYINRGYYNDPEVHGHHINHIHFIQDAVKDILHKESVHWND